MEETTTNPSWFQDAMKKGLILGAIHIIIFLLIYLLIPNKLVSLSYLFLIIVLNIGYSLYNGAQWRKTLGGYIDFGSSFKYVFILLLFNGLLYAVFSVIFLIIDPTFPDMMAQGQLDESMYWAQKFGAPEETLDGMREKFDAQEIKDQYSAFGLLKSFGFIVIIYAISALILGLFVRKRQPETF